MKFSIRDLLLGTVIVALAVGWWIDRGWQLRSRLAIEQLLLLAEEERAEAEENRAMMLALDLELMKDLDVIHPGWRKAKVGRNSKTALDGRRCQEGKAAW